MARFNNGACLRGAIFAASTIALSTFFSSNVAAQAPRFGLTVLSAQENVVSGGDALVQLQVPASNNNAFVKLNGQDITGSFRAVNPTTLQGLVSGLRLGPNEIVAGPRDTGQVSAKIGVTNYPISGPIFTGPHQKPFICQTQNFNLPVTGGNLGPSLDENCSIATRVDYVYRSTDGSLKPLKDTAARPSDLARTTTLDGKTVNYVVRIETGTVNRAIYQIAVLHDPVVDAQPDPWTKPAGWNGRLLYTFGGGCASGYRQGTAGNGGLLDNTDIGSSGLANGFAVATSTLNAFRNKCDDLISAEALMMVKERFIERFGVPTYTVGLGPSGGSMQVLPIAHGYPGLLDGIIPILSFPDVLTFSVPSLDCDLLIHAFNNTSHSWTPAEKAAIAGHQTFGYCNTIIRYAKVVQPNRDESCEGSIPVALRYDPKTNPKGARCSLYDDMVNVFGRDPNTGFARRPLDNVGVQYGLLAFNAGTITADQFIDLNQAIGGYDIDGDYTPARMVADPQALTIAYGAGRINSGRGLDATPIIDFRAFYDAAGDIHDVNRSRVLRARMIAANGNANNHVIITIHPDIDRVLMLSGVFLQMDRWLLNIKNDTAPAKSASEKVFRNKPSDLVDACYDDKFVKITDMAACAKLFPPSLEPRLAAGEPMTNDFIKCALKPVRASDYAKKLTDAQFARLKSVFPDGVCDYTKPPVRKQAVAGTWLAYPSPGVFSPLNK